MSPINRFFIIRYRSLMVQENIILLAILSTILIVQGNCTYSTKLASELVVASNIAFATES